MDPRSEVGDLAWTPPVGCQGLGRKVCGRCARGPSAAVTSSTAAGAASSSSKGESKGVKANLRSVEELTKFNDARRFRLHGLQGLPPVVPFLLGEPLRHEELELIMLLHVLGQPFIRPPARAPGLIMDVHQIVLF